MTPDDLKRLEELAKAAPPGPYRTCGADHEKGCICGLIWSTPIDMAVLHAADEMCGAEWTHEQRMQMVRYAEAAHPAAVLALIEAARDRDMFAEQCLVLNDGAVCYEQELIDRGADLDEVVERQGKALHAGLVADGGATDKSPYIVSVLSELRAQLAEARACLHISLCGYARIEHEGGFVAFNDRCRRALGEEVG